MKILVSPLNVHQKVPSTMEEFNNQGDRMTHSMHGQTACQFTHCPMCHVWAKILELVVPCTHAKSSATARAQTALWNQVTAQCLRPALFLCID